MLTGRLSSNDPNLQNIPVRTEDGRKIRTAFVAPPGKMLISADYSQIELRVLAHIADIQALKDAFEEGLDIHAMTASEMFGVPVEGMPADVRRRAKAINFGIIYGISAFGLANQLGIERSVAGEYIKTYFERFPGIKDYMDEQRRRVKIDGYVTTLFGRKINFPNANSANPAERSLRRTRLDQRPDPGHRRRHHPPRHDPHGAARCKAAGVEADMLLQVHDELIFEVPEDGVDAAIPVIKTTMENAREPGRAAHRADPGRRARGAQLGRGALTAAARTVRARAPRPGRRGSWRAGSPASRRIGSPRRTECLGCRSLSHGRSHRRANSC